MWPPYFGEGVDPWCWDTACEPITLVAEPPNQGVPDRLERSRSS